MTIQIDDENVDQISLKQVDCEKIEFKVVLLHTISAFLLVLLTAGTVFQVIDQVLQVEMTLDLVRLSPTSLIVMYSVVIMKGCRDMIEDETFDEIDNLF